MIPAATSATSTGIEGSDSHTSWNLLWKVPDCGVFQSRAEPPATNSSPSTTLLTGPRRPLGNGGNPIHRSSSGSLQEGLVTLRPALPDSGDGAENHQPDEAPK